MKTKIKIIALFEVFILLITSTACDRKTDKHKYICEYLKENKITSNFLDISSIPFHENEYSTYIDMWSWEDSDTIVFTERFLEFYDNCSREICNIIKYSISTQETQTFDLTEYLYTEHYSDLNLADYDWKLKDRLSLMALKCHDNYIFFIANITSKQDAMIFAVDEETGNVWHSNVCKFSNNWDDPINWAVSEDNRYVYVTEYDGHEYNTVQYDIYNNSKSIYLPCSSDLVFSPNYKYMMYYEVDEHLNRNLIIKDISSDTIVYREDNCPDYTYSFTASENGVFCRQTQIKFTIAYLNRYDGYFIDLTAAKPKKEKIYKTEWGDTGYHLEFVD